MSNNLFDTFEIQEIVEAYPRGAKSPVVRSILIKEGKKTDRWKIIFKPESQKGLMSFECDLLKPSRHYTHRILDRWYPSTLKKSSKGIAYIRK